MFVALKLRAIGSLDLDTASVARFAGRRRLSRISSSSPSSSSLRARSQSKAPDLKVIDDGSDDDDDQSVSSLTSRNCSLRQQWFGGDEARDRDGSYGHAVTRRLAAMGIRDHPIAPRSPWQNGHAERLIGSIRRELPGSHRRLRRGPSAPNPCGLHQLLQRTPYASVPGKGFAGPSAGPTVRPTCCSADPRRTSSSILPDLVLGRHRFQAQLQVYFGTVGKQMEQQKAIFREVAAARLLAGKSDEASGSTTSPASL